MHLLWSWRHMSYHLLWELSVWSMDIIKFLFVVEGGYSLLTDKHQISFCAFISFCEVESMLLSVISAIKAYKLICITGSCRIIKSVSRWWEAFLSSSNAGSWKCHSHNTVQERDVWCCFANRKWPVFLGKHPSLLFPQLAVGRQNFLFWWCHCDASRFLKGLLLVIVNSSC